VSTVSTPTPARHGLSNLAKASLLPGFDCDRGDRAERGLGDDEYDEDVRVDGGEGDDDEEDDDDAAADADVVDRETEAPDEAKPLSKISLAPCLNPSCTASHVV
jgi:hypothetical protein